MMNLARLTVKIVSLLKVFFHLLSLGGDLKKCNIDDSFLELFNEVPQNSAIWIEFRHGIVCAAFHYGSKAEYMAIH